MACATSGECKFHTCPVILVPLPSLPSLSPPLSSSLRSGDPDLFSDRATEGRSSSRCEKSSVLLTPGKSFWWRRLASTLFNRLLICSVSVMLYVLNVFARYCRPTTFADGPSNSWYALNGFPTVWVKWDLPEASSSRLIPSLDLRQTGERWWDDKRLQLSFLFFKQGENDILAVELR